MKKYNILIFLFICLTLFPFLSFAQSFNKYLTLSSITPFSYHLYLYGKPYYKQLELLSYYSINKDNHENKQNIENRYFYKEIQKKVIWYICKNKQRITIYTDKKLNYTNCKKRYTNKTIKVKQKKDTRKHTLTKGHVYRIKNKHGGFSYTNIKPKKSKNYKVMLTYIKKCFACSKNSSINWHNTPLFIHKYQKIISQASHKYHISKALIQSVIHAESAYKPYAISSQGAMGLMQIMPNTAKYLHIKNIYSPKDNIMAGTHYLSKLLHKFHGNKNKTLAAYNAGPIAVIKYQGIPPYEETQNYVKRVNILYNRYKLINF